MSMLRKWVLALALLTMSSIGHAQREGSGFAKLSPFQAVRLDADTPRVEVDGAWHELVALDGVEASRIVAYCRTTYA